MSALPALLLIAHGSRRAEANQELVDLSQKFAGRFSFIATAYLELAEPDILTSGRLCAQSGASCVVMMPYFLSPGVHVREDLLEAQLQLREEFPQVQFLLAEPLGRHPLLIEIIQQRVQEVLRDEKK